MLLTRLTKVLTGSLDNIQPIRKAMKVGTGKSLFSLVSVTQTYDLVNFGSNRQRGTFIFEFLLSADPTATVQPSSSTYDWIMEYFISDTLLELSPNGITLISYEFGDSELVTDPTTGRQSLSFSINIVATKKQ
ncbi:hypothetical protein RM437_07940 [Citrobacter werkmanii]|uniref:hypothetical protein n=1 Tax=Citrobacter werkmanii TaxID=67827 RepID=UPI00288466D5|nr:hypothetical protein [Citrobacter werkmanii]MDT0637965.1 hypothetical protein [Citrobacter werkmanii]